MTNDTTPQLPPLPKPLVHDFNEPWDGTARAYTADQMQAYARAAQAQPAPGADELAITEKLLADRQRVLDAIPACPMHGACVPHALEWIEKAKADLQALAVGQDALLDMLARQHVDALDAVRNGGDGERTALAVTTRALVEHAAAVSPAVADGWRHIDEAPKDGTEVWAFNGEQARMRWIEGGEEMPYALWIWADDVLGEVDPSPDQPTHFRPLPAAPSSLPLAHTTGGE